MILCDFFFLAENMTFKARAAGQLCTKLLYEYGARALRDVESKKLTDAVEKVIEANILLSGCGFECGGISASHGVQAYLTMHPVASSEQFFF